jgi:hypothetical protein
MEKEDYDHETEICHECQNKQKREDMIICINCKKKLCRKCIYIFPWVTVIGSGDPYNEDICIGCLIRDLIKFSIFALFLLGLPLSVLFIML